MFLYSYAAVDKTDVACCQLVVCSWSKYKIFL